MSIVPSCQLAKDGSNHPKKLIGVKQIEFKLDGVRVLSVIYQDGTVQQFSRNGKELKNFPLIREQLSALASEFSETMVLDGEVTSTSFQALMTQVHRKYDVDASDAILALFDIVPLSEVSAGCSTLGQSDRSLRLAEVVTSHSGEMPNVRVVDTRIVDLDTDSGHASFIAINKSALENGYEGIMVKTIDAKYEPRRTFSWLKIKPFIEVSLTIDEIIEGEGKYVGVAGAIACSGIDDGKNIEVSVGTGLSDSLRRELWLSRESSIGSVIEVRADAITRNQDGGYSLRFPRFVRFRGFEPGEKL